VHYFIPGTIFQGKTQRSETVATGNLRLLTLSVVNRQPAGDEQASTAINAYRRFLANGRIMEVYTFAHAPNRR
jgi:hypothetical protein